MLDHDTGVWVPQTAAPAANSYVFAVMDVRFASASSGGTSGSPGAGVPNLPPLNLPPGGLPPLLPPEVDRRIKLNNRFDQLVAGLTNFEPTFLTTIVAKNMAIENFYTARREWRQAESAGLAISNAPYYAATYANFLLAQANMRQVVQIYNFQLDLYNDLWLQITAIQLELWNNYGLNRGLVNQFELLPPANLQDIENGGYED